MFGHPYSYKLSQHIAMLRRTTELHFEWLATTRFICSTCTAILFTEKITQWFCAVPDAVGCKSWPVANTYLHFPGAVAGLQFHLTSNHIALQVSLVYVQCASMKCTCASQRLWQVLSLNSSRRIMPDRKWPSTLVPFRSEASMSLMSLIA